MLAGDRAAHLQRRGEDRVERVLGGGPLHRRRPGRTRSSGGGCRRRRGRRSPIVTPWVPRSPRRRRSGRHAAAARRRRRAASCPAARAPGGPARRAAISSRALRRVVGVATASAPGRSRSPRMRRCLDAAVGPSNCTSRTARRRARRAHRLHGVTARDRRAVHQLEQRRAAAAIRAIHRLAGGARCGKSRRACRRRRRAAQPDGGLDDDAERALRADEQAGRSSPRRPCGSRARVRIAPRRPSTTSSASTWSRGDAVLHAAQAARVGRDVAADVQIRARRVGRVQSPCSAAARQVSVEDARLTVAVRVERVDLEDASMRATDRTMHPSIAFAPPARPCRRRA